jgi:hypothetical protein
VNSIFLNAIASVAIATWTVPSPAHDQPIADVPVSVASCSVVPEYDPAGFGESALPSVGSGASVWISFQNRSARTATDVTFLLSTLAGAMTVTDRGRFSSGVDIEHILGPYADLQGGEACALYSVRFDDGATWQRP